MADSYDDLQQSYGRCLRDKHFIERFYETFLASHPSIPPLFAHTDMSRQQLALRRGISVAILHAAGSALARRTIEKMAEVHGMGGRAPVPPQLYAYWLDSLIQVIAATDPEANVALLLRWRQAMAVVIRTFIGRYDADAAG